MKGNTTTKWVLPVIVIAQFLCTSLWFAGNAVLPAITAHFSLGPAFLANLTSAVQFGFISGTLLFAVFTVADRFSPSKVFFACSILGALFNAGVCFPGIASTGLLAFRFLTGFFLAGIYPVGMKIASDYYQKGLGRSLGFLVGALVTGTSFPHLLNSFATGISWKYVLFTVSALSIIGGLCILLFVPDGPFRKPAQQLKWHAFAEGFRHRPFRAAAFGYFGHMWELYTFWAFVPVMLSANKTVNHNALNIPLLSFLVIASGGLSCVLGGILSQWVGAKKIATIVLFLSGCCCVLSPLFLLGNSEIVLLAFLFIWGTTVVADSPLFSTLVAQNVPEQVRGSSLTIVNCIGFSITIVSIQVTKILAGYIDAQYLYMILAIGPVLGLVALYKRK